jgi:hypothetical protein
MKKKSILSVLLAVIMVFSLTSTVFAATGKTVTFNGGHIYQTEKGKPGTIQIKLSNIVKTKKSVKIDLMDYIDDASVAETIFGYTEEDEAIKLKDIMSDGITVYYADKSPVTVTSKSALTCFWVSYTGNVEKATYTPKYYSFDDYLSNPDKAKVLKTKPEGDYFLAPRTSMKLTKSGKFLFIVKDDGFIDGSPISAFCVIVK